MTVPARSSIIVALATGALLGALLARPLLGGESATAAMDASFVSWADGPPQGRMLSPEQMDRIEAVAKDLSPDLAARLAAARARDAEAFRAALGSQGKRLGGLAVLRERKPDLYAARIQELKLESQVVALGEQLHSAVDAGRGDEASALQAKLAPLVLTFVDSNLRSRAMELAALDGVMRELRTSLEEDARVRTQTADRWIEALRAGSEPPPLGGRRTAEVPQPTP